MQATDLWCHWQELLAPYAAHFTRPGFVNFVTWATGLALNVEEHTITQSLVGLDRPQDWKALESFAEYGAWDEIALEQTTARLLAEIPDSCWFGYHVWAGDDTKVHRTSATVWGTCTFHEYTARCPNRATTVRAHNWVVVGSLLPRADQPAWFVPTAGRLYFRKAQLPAGGNLGDPPGTFRTKCDLMVAALRQQADVVAGRHLAVVDGGYALRSVVRPLVCPAEPDRPRVDFVTRLRHDARLYRRPQPRRPGQRGRTPIWGKRLAPPRQGGRWPAAWQEGEAFIYGRRRQVRWKEVVCLWRVLGHDVPVKAVVAKSEGYRPRFTLVTSATTLTGLQVVELFCARFRQEDGFRDLKQRLGWEEGRAWTRLPILRTTLLLFVVLATLRRLEFRLQASGDDPWWLQPPWNPHKQRPSVLDLERLLRGQATGIRQLLTTWREDGEQTLPPQLEVAAM